MCARTGLVGVVFETVLNQSEARGSGSISRLSAKSREQLLNPGTFASSFHSAYALQQRRPAGTSLGGLGGLIYLKEHPDDLAGVLSIAPFLGDDELIREIEQAGGASGWTAPPKIDGEEIGVTLWRWLSAGRPGSASIPLHLGWGSLDDFDRSNRLLARMLPPERTYLVDGGHDVEAWSLVWAEFLDSARPCEDIK